MLRSLLIHFSKAVWAQKTVSRWGIARKAASRFVAGETIEDAIRVVREFNARGINTTLDHLGEHTGTPEEAERACRDILTALDRIQDAGVRSNVSIKLTQIGMGLDEGLCRSNLHQILSRAAGYRNFVRIDVEDTPYSDGTIALYLDALDGGFSTETVGMAVQSYLYRAEADALAMLARGTRLRLVKGAYQEPPDRAFPRKADVDANYDRLASRLLRASHEKGTVLDADGRIPPIAALATHDLKRITAARSEAERFGLTRSGVEFQMLYGIRRDLQTSLAADGYPVRVYVPYGTHWYPYFMRRLAERPANLWFFISNFIKG